MTMYEEEKITKEDVIEELKSVTDPEIGIDLVTLGLIYEVNMDKNEAVKITMTLTAAGCPFADLMVKQVKQAAMVAGASEAEVEVVFDPPWEPSEELRALLGI